MPFVNVAAMHRYDGRFATKKAMRDAIASEPQNVLFVGTSPLGPQLDWPLHADKLPAGYNLSVTGPDPRNDRKWYATVTVKNGKAIVK